jgi:hypothetical protein
LYDHELGIFDSRELPKPFRLRKKSVAKTTGVPVPETVRHSFQTVLCVISATAAAVE